MSNTHRLKQIKGEAIGSVIFIGANGQATEDNTNFFWDDSNNRLGIGIAVPLAGLHAASSIRFSGLTTPAIGHILQATSVNGDLDWADPGTLLSGVLELNDLIDVTTGLPGSPTIADDGKMLHYDFTAGAWITDDSVTHGTVVVNAKKSSAGTIAKGTPVYLVGFDSDLHTVEVANATSSATMPVIGFAAEALDATNSKHIITFGKLQGIDTTATGAITGGETWAVNEDLYMSTTAGELTNTRPTGASTQIQRVAKVLNVNVSGGQIFIFNTARTAGLPNLTDSSVWIGNGSNQPIEALDTTLGIYAGSGTIQTNTIATITDNLSFLNGEVSFFSDTPANKFSITPERYSTGTASQSLTTITGVGTNWLTLMIGDQFVFADGTNAGTIVSRASATSIDVDTSATVASQAYSINYTGLQVQSNGKVGIGTTNIDYYADVIIRGRNENTKEVLRIEDQEGVNIMQVRESGQTVIGKTAGANVNATLTVAGGPNNALVIDSSPIDGSNNTTANNTALSFVLRNSLGTKVAGSGIWCRHRNVIGGDVQGVDTIVDNGPYGISQSYVGIATTGGVGNGLTLDVTTDGAGAILTVTVNNDGTEYVNNNVITIDGTLIGGAATPANDATVQVNNTTLPYDVMVINNAIQTEAIGGTTMKNARTMVSTENRHTHGGASGVFHVENRSKNTTTTMVIDAFAQSTDNTLIVRSSNTGTAITTTNWQLLDNHKFTHNVANLTTGDFILEGGTDAFNFISDASTDRIGIGIAAPLAKLHIEGNGATSGTSALIVEDLNGNNELFRVYDDGAIRMNSLATTPAAGYVLQSTDVNGNADWVNPTALASSNTVVEIQTTDATADVELLVGGGGGTRVPVATNSVQAFRITVTGILSADSGGGGIGDIWVHKFEGAIKNIAGTTQLVGSVTETTIAEDTFAAWSANVTADNTNNALVVKATGELSKDIEWLAEFEITENSY